MKLAHTLSRGDLCLDRRVHLVLGTETAMYQRTVLLMAEDKPSLRVTVTDASRTEATAC